MFLDKKNKLVTSFTILLLVSITWYPLINIIEGRGLPEIVNENKNNQINTDPRSDFEIDTSPAILQYTAPKTTVTWAGANNSYEIVTKVICGMNFPNASGNRSYIYCFESATGELQENKVAWRYHISDVFGIHSSPAVANIDPTTDTPEIVFGADNGKVYCLNYAGKLLWSFSLDLTNQQPISSSPAIADIYDDPSTIDDNGYLEIVVGSENNKLYFIYFDSERAQWTFKNTFTTDGKIQSSPTISDIDDDGNLNIIVGSDDGRLYCLNEELVKQWEFNTGAPIRSTAGIADINRDGNLEVIFGSDNGNVYCLDNTGKEIDIYAFGTPIRSSPAIANIDSSDETLEFVIGYDSGSTHSSASAACLKLKYESSAWKIKAEWTFSSDYTQNLDLKLNVIAIDKDAYPDGSYEVILADGNKIYVLNSQGNKETEYIDHLHGGAPVVGDIDNDGKLEITTGYKIEDTITNTEHLKIVQTNHRCPPNIIKWGMFGAGEKHNGNGDNRYAILIEGSKGDNPFEQDQFRSDIQEVARILTVHPDNTGLGYTGHYLKDHIFYVGVHDDIPEIDVYRKIPENNDLINASNNDPADTTGKQYIFDTVTKVANLCDSYDSVVFYYTSHGKYSGSSYNSRTYLFDANDCHEPYSEIGDLSPDGLNYLLDKITCRKLFVILQPCYSGDWVKYLNNKGNRVIIASDISTNPGARSRIAIFDKCNIEISDTSVHDLYYIGSLDKDGTIIDGIDDSDPKIDGEEYDNSDTDQQEFGKTYQQWYCWVRKLGSNNELYEIDKSRSDNLDINGEPQFNKMFYENFKDQGAEFNSGLTEAFYKDYLTDNNPSSNDVLDADEGTTNRYLYTNGDSNGYISCKEAFEFMKLWHFGIQQKKAWEDNPVIIYTKLPEGENYLLF